MRPTNHDPDAAADAWVVTIGPARARIRTLAASAMACVLTLSLTGCEHDRPGAAIPESGAGATWRWRATAMKVSALSTPLPTASSQESSIDVRVAFFDTEHDETKAIGVLTVILTSSGVEIGRTEIPLSDQRNHQKHWDSVTETYSVRLPLAGNLEPQPGQSVEVRAVFEGEDGSLMRASRDVKWPTLIQSAARRKETPATAKSGGAPARPASPGPSPRGLSPTGTASSGPEQDQ
ncbi:MAG: hypothetical protein JNK53_08810 [Phycisphaerae bacterium]|nr:hypothetical protein [Phycisphaerae bacterium]